MRAMGAAMLEKAAMMQQIRDLQRSLPARNQQPGSIPISSPAQLLPGGGGAGGSLSNTVAGQQGRSQAEVEPQVQVQRQQPQVSLQSFPTSKLAQNQQDDSGPGSAPSPKPVHSSTMPMPKPTPMPKPKPLASRQLAATSTVPLPENSSTHFFIRFVAYCCVPVSVCIALV